MRKHGGTPSERDEYVTVATISPQGDARGRFVGGHHPGLAGCKPPSLFMRRASSCPSQRRSQGEPRGVSPQPSAPTLLYLAPLPSFHPPFTWAYRFLWGGGLQERLWDTLGCEKPESKLFANAIIALKPEAFFNLGANSTMAPRNSMRSKIWSSEETTFPPKFGQNGHGAKACSRGQWRCEPQINAI